MEEKRVEQKVPGKKGYRDRALQARYERYRGVLKELIIMLSETGQISQRTAGYEHAESRRGFRGAAGEPCDLHHAGRCAGRRSPDLSCG